MRELVRPDSSLRRRAALALFGASAFWGLSFPLNKAVGLAHERVSAEAGGWFVTVTSIWPRFGVAMLLLAMFGGRAAWRWRRDELAQGVALALLMACGLVLQVDGLRFTEASTSAFLSQFFVIVLPAIVFGGQRRWPPPRFIAAAFMVLGGVAVLSNTEWRALRMGRGEIETLISTAFFGLQILVLGSARFRANRPVPVTFIMFTVTSLVFLAAAFALAPRSGSIASAVLAPWHFSGWVIFTVLLALVCTLGAFMLMNTWQPRLNTAEAGLIYASEPVFAALLALFVPAWFSDWGNLDYANESVTWRLLVGGGLITAANVLIQLTPPARVHVASIDPPPPR